MDSWNILQLLMLIGMHFGVLSYFDEYLVARHPLFQCKMKIAKVVEFGRSKVFYRVRCGTTEFYTIVCYYEQSQEYMAKIFRSMDDEIGKEIVVAVKENGKLATRYEKCNWYGEVYGMNKGGVTGLKCCVCMYAFLYMMTICWFILEFEVAWKAYQIYILAVILHYLLLPQIVNLRNFIWDKDWNHWFTNERKKFRK